MERLRAAEFTPRRKPQERLEKKTAGLLKDWGVNGKWEKSRSQIYQASYGTS